MSLFLVFLALAALIMLHEAGHFLAAKAVGMRVERFSLFFGRMVVKKQIGETLYGIGVIPLGGYVKIAGMSPNEVFEEPSHEARAYINQPVWKRIVVIAAGPVVNILVAFLLLWAYYLGSARHVVVTPQNAVVATNTVGQIAKGSPAHGVMQVGDTIVSVDGVKGNYDGIHEQIQKHGCVDGARVNDCQASTQAAIVVRRHGALKTLHVRPRWNAEAQAMLIGISFYDETAPNGVVYSAGQSITHLWLATSATVSTIAHIFESRARRQLHSIVGVSAIAQQDFSAGWTNAVGVVGLISLALGLMNLIPLLPLDGGHIFWAVAEKLRGHRIPYKVMERATIVGFAVILLLFVIGFSNDVSTLAGSGFHTQ
jgi:regulator of sigma E protease